MRQCLSLPPVLTSTSKILTCSITRLWRSFHRFSPSSLGANTSLSRKIGPKISSIFGHLINSFVMKFLVNSLKNISQPLGRRRFKWQTRFHTWVWVLSPDLVLHQCDGSGLTVRCRMEKGRWSRQCFSKPAATANSQSAACQTGEPFQMFATAYLCPLWIILQYGRGVVDLAVVFANIQVLTFMFGISYHEVVISQFQILQQKSVNRFASLWYFSAAPTWLASSAKNFVLIFRLMICART